MYSELDNLQEDQTYTNFKIAITLVVYLINSKSICHWMFANFSMLAFLKFLRIEVSNIHILELDSFDLF